MLTHTAIWAALDALARRHGLTPSGLARRAGLDPTAFNKSKRRSPVSGKLHWPSTETLAKALDAVAANMHDYAALIGEPAGVRTIPFLPWPAVRDGQVFSSDGVPRTPMWDTAPFPNAASTTLFAIGAAPTPLDFEGVSDLVLCPDHPIGVDDFALIKPREGRACVAQICAIDEALVTVGPVCARHSGCQTHARVDMAWMSRIVWPAPRRQPMLGSVHCRA